MKKVMCIEEVKNNISDTPSIIRVGNIYTVVSVYEDKEGVWYELNEELGYEYTSDHFAYLSDLDETIIHQETLLQTVK